MQKILMVFIAFHFIFLPIEKYFVFCKMSQGSKCTCSGKHSKHNCCKILKISKELAIDLKIPKISLNLNFLNFSRIFEEKAENFLFEIFKLLKIHSPPIFLKNLNLLI